MPGNVRCRNCKNTYIDGDKYCRFCGALLGEPVFVREEFACIYGPPPMRRVHTCNKCNYTWVTNQMIDDQEFCPKCGGKAPADEGK